MILLLFLAALLASVTTIAYAFRQYAPQIKALRFWLAQPEAPGEVRVIVYPQPSRRPVARSIANFRRFARMFGRHHEPKPVTHRLHRFEKSVA